MTPRRFALVLALCVVGIAGALWWMNHRQRLPTEPEITAARERSAVVAAETKTTEATLLARVDTVTRWLTRTVHDTVPTRALHPVTHEDTTAAVAALPAVEARYQGCRQELSALLSDCDRFRASALRRFAADSTTMTVQQRALDARRIPSRWSVGLCALYGIVRTPDGALRTGEAIGVCGSYRVF